MMMRLQTAAARDARRAISCHRASAHARKYVSAIVPGVHARDNIQIAAYKIPHMAGVYFSLATSNIVSRMVSRVSFQSDYMPES